MFRGLKCTQLVPSGLSASFFQSGSAGAEEEGSDNKVARPVGEKRWGEAEGSLQRSSCVWKLVDVSQVGVVEDCFDPIQRLCLSYPLQLDLRTQNQRLGQMDR